MDSDVAEGGSSDRGAACGDGRTGISGDGAPVEKVGEAVAVTAATGERGGEEGFRDTNTPQVSVPKETKNSGEGVESSPWAPSPRGLEDSGADAVSLPPPNPPLRQEAGVEAGNDGSTDTTTPDGKTSEVSDTVNSVDDVKLSGAREEEEDTSDKKISENCRRQSSGETSQISDTDSLNAGTLPESKALPEESTNEMRLEDACIKDVASSAICQLDGKDAETALETGAGSDLSILAGPMDNIESRNDTLTCESSASDKIKAPGDKAEVAHDKNNVVAQDEKEESVTAESLPDRSVRDGNSVEINQGTHSASTELTLDSAENLVSEITNSAENSSITNQHLAHVAVSGGSTRKERPFEDSTDVSELNVVNSSSNSTLLEQEPEGAEGGGELKMAAASTKLHKEGSQAQSVYHLKWTYFKSKKVPIITQNENGPCPLLAIMNVLLLQGRITLEPGLEFITSDQLMDYLGECILENVPKVISMPFQNTSEDVQLNYQQNMQDGMTVIPKLQTGLDVNVRFTGVQIFEYTTECIIFDLLGISLYHGWLVDPQEQETVSAIGMCSYNQLVEKIIGQKTSEKDELVTEALIAETFLEKTASQLTYHGLCELNSTVKEGELCVFFRNNHFSTLYRHKNELFLLVTDQGFLTEGNVVWETLSSVEGDCYFVDAEFNTYTKPDEPPDSVAPPSVPIGSNQQIDHDFLVALSLDQEQLQEEVAWGKTNQHRIQQSDHELAKRLQDEENQRASAAAATRRQQRPVAGASGSSVTPNKRSREKDKDKDGCQIL